MGGSNFEQTTRSHQLQHLCGRTKAVNISTSLTSVDFRRSACAGLSARSRFATSQTKCFTVFCPVTYSCMWRLGTESRQAVVPMDPQSNTTETTSLVAHLTESTAQHRAPQHTLYHATLRHATQGDHMITPHDTHQHTKRKHKHAHTHTPPHQHTATLPERNATLPVDKE